MSDDELEADRALLGVGADVAPDALKKAYVQKSYALIRASAAEEERARLRVAHERLTAHLAAAVAVAPAAGRGKSTGAKTAQADAELARYLATAGKSADAEVPLGTSHPASFDSRWVNIFAPPLIVLVGILVKRSFLGFFLTGFHVWIHEFGHATIGWLTGHRALPLPIGWTPIAAEKSLFVYFGILFLLGLMLVAGVRERKLWPVVLAVALALAQAFMTWRLPEAKAQEWIAFGGVGGEFYLAAAMMALFYFQFPGKFEWGWCRYFFLFVGAGSFCETYLFWKKVKRGEEGIPYGSMINGEEDAGGDMNGLHFEYGWTQREIIHTYNNLGAACVVALVVLYLIFALRLDRPFAQWLAQRGGGGDE